MGYMAEFKKFALKGNVMDMAVGIIIGAAFGKVVSSLVKDIIMPPIGVLIDGVNFSQLKWVIQQATEDLPEVAIAYGAFLQTIIDFLIISLSIFVAVKVINSMQRKEEEKPAAPPEPSASEKLLTEIRDLLKSDS